MTTNYIIFSRGSLIAAFRRSTVRVRKAGTGSPVDLQGVFNYREHVKTWNRCSSKALKVEEFWNMKMMNIILRRT